MNTNIRELSDEEKVEKLLEEADKMLANGQPVNYYDLVRRYGLAGRMSHIEVAIMHSDRRHSQ